MLLEAGRWCQQQWRPSIDACADDAGALRQPMCVEHLSLARPISTNWRRLVGKVFFANPPFSDIDHILSHLCQAVAADPANTRGTVVLPVRPTEAWWRRWVSRRNAPLRPVGAPLAPKSLTFKQVNPTTGAAYTWKSIETMQLFRMGWTPTERARLEHAPDRSSSRAQPSEPAAFFPEDEAEPLPKETHLDPLSAAELLATRQSAATALREFAAAVWGSASTRQLRAWEQHSRDAFPAPAPERWFIHPMSHPQERPPSGSPQRPRPANLERYEGS
ncbi:hypothetical protein NFJ02_19g33890 [Pycnococcus provasolii]